MLAAVARHAHGRPDDIAVTDGTDEISYGRLYALVRRYAEELRRSGVRPGDSVGLCARRGPATVVAMLALLRAGAAFVPLDPDDPAERLRSIAERGGVGAAVSPGRWAAEFERAGLRVLPPVPPLGTDMERPDDDNGPDDDGGGGSGDDGPAVVADAHPDDLAYIIHTSGSTGQPKGVAIPRRALDHFSREIAAGYGLSPGDRVLQFSSISFDGSIEEIFPPLYAGATVVVRDEGTLASPGAFLDRCAELGLTVLHIPTAYWHEVVDAMVHDGLRLPGPARIVSVGGEEIRQDRVADWRRLHTGSPVRLVNVYGPTETTVVATWDDLAGPLAAVRTVDAPATIGRPLPGVRIRIVGSDGPVAQGEEGELHIGGPTVAAGYVNLPELTAERFGTGPDGVRYYHTGDRVRQLSDGSLVYLGRMDRQIKVRGFRVEPTEVEQVLLADPRVRDAVVRYDARRATLVGYLLPAAEAPAVSSMPSALSVPSALTDLDLAELTAYLSDRLPAYAVPSRLVPVEAFPLNSRGKVDAEALAALPLRPTGGASGSGTPEALTGTEGTLADLIADVLGVESVGADDSVFLLGANSLTAIRIVTRIERAFRVRFTLADLYANPTVAALSALLAEAEPNTAPDLGESGTGSGTGADADDRLPLTPFQQDAWLAEQLHPGTPMHTLGLRYRVTGPVDAAAVTAALRQLAERHEALRAVFDQSDDRPLMAFGGRTPDIEVSVHDLRELPAGQREIRRGELAGARGRTVLDLATGPLLAATLLRLDNDVWELVVAVHHLVFDGWSASVLADDLAHLLDGVRPAPAGRFSPHLRRARRSASDPARRAALLSHWTDRLDGIDTDVEVPADRPRPAVRSFTGAKIEHRLDPALLSRVDEAARASGTTTHTFVLAALQTLVARLTGRTDITVLAPVAHRDDPDSERGVGAFINILPLRTDLSGDPDFRTALRRATETVVGALSHPDQSLSELVRALPVVPRADRGPLSQVMLIVVNTPASVARHGAMTVEHLGDTFPGTTKLDLTVTLDFPASGPVLSVEYATELFDRTTAQRLLENLLTLLANALDEPTAAISRLTLLSPERRQEVLAAGHAATAPADGRQGASAVPGQGGVHTLFEEHARRTPDAPAVTHGGPHWSYARLDREAERLARRLRAAGVTTGDRVGIHLPQGPTVYAAVLAVWKAGAAYVPLDPRYPAERLRHMFTDSGARALLTDGPGDPAGFAAPDGVPVILTTGAGAGAEAADADTAALAGQQVTAADPAYVLYTSGTTGLPKGVVVSHGNLHHAVVMWREAYGLTPGMSHLQAANSSFDVFVGETLRALGTGGRIVVCPHETLLDPEALYGLLRDEKVNVAELVPTVLRGLLDHAESRPGAGQGAPEPLPELRLLAGGAEKWYVHEYRRALALVGPGGRVVNSYGVTEATVDNAYFEGDVSGEPAQAPLPIGRPYPGNRLYVLDAHGRPLPFGVPGELWIGGPGVATGYHDRPGLTEERFRPDPFDPIPGGRMYRTGDGARLRADGVMAFLGRLDDQVKINGHRIELDEVEAALAAQPGVRAAAVSVCPDSRGIARLVGYAVPVDPAQPPTAEALRRGVQEILPHYAIPARTVILSALPLSANGKVDRKTLPQPAEELDSGARTEPRTGTEKELVTLWGEVLGRERIALNDGFFDLGGDSFAALRLVRLVEQRCGVRVALLDLYRNATVERLAEHIAQRTGAMTGAMNPVDPTRAGTVGVGGEGSLLQRLTPDRARPGQDLAAATLVCIPYSGGQALAFEPVAKALPDDWSLYALQSPGRDWSRPDEEALPFDELIDRCLDEMRELPGPVYLYGHCHGSAITLELGMRAEAAGLLLAGVAIGAMFPMARLPGRFFDWVYRHFPVDRLVSDRAILEEIRALGGGMSEFEDPAEYAFAMRSVRHDERGSEHYYARTLSRGRDQVLKAPLLSVVGSKDRVTELYTERFREWEHYADDVELAVIPKAGHGFLKHQAAELAEELATWAGRRAEPDVSSEAPADPDSGTQDLADPGSRTQAPATAEPSGPEPSLGRFSAVAAGQFVSTVGSALSQLVMSLWVYQRTGQVTAFAFVAAVSLLPGLLVGPLAGVVADRYDRRKVMLFSDLAAGLSVLAMIGLITGDRVSMPYVYLLCGLTSVTSAFQRPAYLAAVAQLVPKPFLGHAGGITQLGTGAGALFAPMLGAGLLSVVSLPVILLIDLATFVVAVATLLLVRFPDRLFRRREEPVRSEMLNGWRYITRRPGLKSVLWYFVVDHSLYAVGFALITPLVLIEYDTATLGVVLSGGGLGALLGSLAMSVWGGTRRRTDGMLLFMGANNLGLLVIGLAGRPWLLVAGMFGMAFTESLINGHWIALLQRKVGLELQGRVLAIFITVVTATMPLGYLVVGPLADHVFRPMLMPDGALAGSFGTVLGTGPGRGLALVIVVSGLLLTLWTVRAWFNRKLRFVEDVLPDAVPDPEIEDRDTEQRRADERLLRAVGGLPPTGPTAVTVPASAPAAAPTTAEEEWLDTWRTVYDTSYAGSWDAMGEDFTGWDSSYDGSAIPVAEMCEWRDATVDRILETRPRRVLEIGVGSGVFLARIAPHCEKYVGTDLSPVAVETLDRQLEAHPALQQRVELRAQPAHITTGLPDGYFDTLVINSVVQYFPSGDYLTGVLTGVLRLLAPGGRVFIGDVRNLRLQECFTSAVQHRRAPAGTDAATRRALVDQAMETENELLLDPAYFTAFAERSGGVVAVDVRTKRGAAHNELNRYRYDVLLATAPADVVPMASVPTLAWGTEVTSLDDLAARLARTLPLRVTGVPNARLREDLAALDELSGTGTDIGTATRTRPSAPDPEEFHRLGDRLGHWTATTWSPTDDDCLDVVFAPRADIQGRCVTGLFSPSFTASFTPSTEKDRASRPLTNIPGGTPVPAGAR
ncbi:amino acid adenylation domain-containing protein [Streptomyces sp. NPDC059479]|uniref:amino acid adenylation domain-containing protein n=1 Tax=Streptomyces sp. NPDC059479 TaxID=3346848 RepID=UPI0036B36EAA